MSAHRSDPGTRTKRIGPELTHGRSSGAGIPEHETVDLPAVVRIVVDDADFRSVRQRGDAKLVPFDEGDDPNLRSRNQWVILPGGVQFLNARLNSVESLLIAMR